MPPDPPALVPGAPRPTRLNAMRLPLTGLPPPCSLPVNAALRQPRQASRVGLSCSPQPACLHKVTVPDHHHHSSAAAGCWCRVSAWLNSLHLRRQLQHISFSSRLTASAWPRIGGSLAGRRPRPRPRPSRSRRIYELGVGTCEERRAGRRHGRGPPHRHGSARSRSPSRAPRLVQNGTPLLLVGVVFY